MAALVAALLIRATDASADMVSSAAERSSRPGRVLLAVVLALAVTQSLAAVGGSLVAAHLTPNASRLLFALALLMAGGGAVWPRKPAKPAGTGIVTVTAKLIAGGIGDRTMFATFAVAAGGPPVLAGVGGFVGGTIVLAIAAVAGEPLWRQRPARSIEWTIGGVLLIAGAWLAASALRLA